MLTGVCLIALWIWSWYWVSWTDHISDLRNLQFIINVVNPDSQQVNFLSHAGYELAKYLIQMQMFGLVLPTQDHTLLLEVNQRRKPCMECECCRSLRTFRWIIFSLSLSPLPCFPLAPSLATSRKGKLTNHTGTQRRAECYQLEGALASETIRDNWVQNYWGVHLLTVPNSLVVFLFFYAKD